MNPQVQQVIDNINQYIVENHNNEITANVLNPILIELANLFDIVGDLSDLTTEDNTSIVNAINELVQSISEIAGINKFYGTANPNQTPPVGYADGDLYFRTASFLGNPYTVYIYNGITWVEIRDPQDVTNEVIQMATPELLSSPTRIKIPNEITQDDEPLLYPIIWKILGVEHQEDNEQIFEINDASENNYRKDLILATQFGTIIKLEGVESEEGVLEPQVPPNMLVLTSITMFGDSVFENPTDPTLGGEYIKKPNNWVNISNAGNNSDLYDISEVLRAFNITSYYGSGKVTGFALGISGNNPFLVQTIRIKNSSEDEIPLEHNSGDLVIPFWFENEEDYILKPTEILTLVLRNGKFEIVSSSLGGDSSLLNNIIADVTVGGVNAGDTLAEGMNLTEVVEAIFSKTFYPTFTPYSISGSAGSAVEVGTGTKDITLTFTRGNIVGDSVGGVWNPSLVQGQRLGTAIKYWIDSIDNGTSIDLEISKLTTLGTNSIPISVDYNAGAQPLDSKGDNYQTPQPAGSLSNTVTWQGFYYRTAIAGNSTPTASDIRTSYTARRSNAGVINMPTGTTNVRFDVFLPQGSSLTSAIDEGNLNLNITAEFILQGSNFSGLDANGDEVLYKHYVRIVDNPYTVSSNIAITVT